MQQTPVQKICDKSALGSAKTAFRLALSPATISRNTQQRHETDKEEFLGNYGILFDLDGTLVDSLPDICGNLNRVRATLGLPALDAKVLVKHIGKGVEPLIHGGFPEISSDQRDMLILKYRAHYNETPHWGGAAYPGVLETLTKLRKNPNVTLAVVTNKDTSAANRTLAHYLPGITFDCVAGPDTVSKRKPAPEHLTEVMARLELLPKNVWFIGDDPVDRDCAAAAGVKFIAATYGFGGVIVDDEERRLNHFPDLLGKLGDAIQRNAR